MLERLLADYGAPYLDAKPMKNPTTQLSSGKGNRIFADLAGLTHTGVRAIVHFNPRDTNGVCTVPFHTSVWGSSDTEKPVCSRVLQGRYTVAYATELTDELGVAETIAFRSCLPSIWSENADGVWVRSCAANAVTLWVRDSADAPSDLLGTETIVLWIR